MSGLFTKKETKKKEPKAVFRETGVTEISKPSAGARHHARSAEFALVLTRPHITEKATRQAESNAYIFVVKNRATKPQLRHAVENKYGVHVTKVNTVNIPTREVERRRGAPGPRRGFKKAIVTLREGEKIEL